jgi:hypothetical protein
MQGFLQSLQSYLETSRLAHFMVHSSVGWPLAESIHFIGLTLLIGTVGLFDLRLMGFAKSLSPSAMHHLIRLGVLGFAMNAVTGTLFFVGIPYQYIYNGAFQAKLICLMLLGINVLVFYGTVSRKVATLGPGDDAPLGAKIIASISLCLWIAVICFGRLEAFSKP